MSDSVVTSATKASTNVVLKLVVVAVLMFGFGYALVPLYDAFCRVTGFGGKTDIIEQAIAENAVVLDRDVAGNIYNA